MKIECAQNSDLKEVAKMYVEVYSKFLPNEGWTYETALNFIKYNFEKQPDLFFVAKAENNILGFSFGYIKPWSDGNQLMAEELVVDYKLHRQNIGKNLFLKLVSTAKDKYNVNTINGVTYLGKNDMPYSWYDRIGFKRVDDLFLVAGNAKTILKSMNEKIKE